jgi:hypothetical protein
MVATGVEVGGGKTTIRVDETLLVERRTKGVVLADGDCVAADHSDFLIW